MKLAKTYDPNLYEPDIYAMWEKSGAFEPTGVGEPFSIVMPPPNANGNLHIGHALMADVEDIMIRYHRMQGRDTVYIPGADHAGFETWVVYEKQLAAQGKSRFDYSREDLYSQVWDFVEKQRGNMELQLRALGASASWKDLVFTLDKKVIDTVYKTFKKLWDEGLIYRGERIVNYSTKYQTGYADIEVDHKLEKGTLWQIAYPTIDRLGEIVVATTRPETIFGDVAIAVHPDDKRYKDYIGKHVLVPLTDREIPIIADEYVDPAFGTGVLKITPAHDPNDFEVGERHGLERLQVIDYDGTMINVPKEFEGLCVDEARKRIIVELEGGDYFRGKSEIEHTVGYDYKSGLPIEPMLKEQWFIKIQPLAQRAKKAIMDGEITFTPENKGKVLNQYYDNLRDWNISRQIPWGIPIPAFQNVDDPSDWIFDERVDEQTITVDGKTYAREEDTFDAWFSSGQWPFITTDYLTDGELAKFYPSSVMETGGDILYAWVSRMIMLGLYVTDKVPFKHVYLHGLVLDEKGQKMSKSKGNVINPMDAVSKYGSDALRIGIVSNRSAAQNQAFSIDRIISGRNFCNKLWNIARFIEGKLGDEYKPTAPEPKSLADHWITHELLKAASDIESMVETYRFAEAAEAVYHAIWDNVADWYVEASKLGSSKTSHITDTSSANSKVILSGEGEPVGSSTTEKLVLSGDSESVDAGILGGTSMSQDNDAMLAWVLDTSLKIAHPFAPFVTETIWQTLPWHDDLLMTAKWPESIEFDDIAAAEFTRLKHLVVEARYVISELPGNERYTMLYQNDSLIADNADLIKKLARLGEVKYTDQAKGLRLANSGREAWLDISAETLYEHQANLETRLCETNSTIKVLEARLANETYVKKAPTQLVDETREQLTQKKALVARLQYELQIIS